MMRTIAVKIAILLAFVAGNTLFTVACARVYRQYEVVFSPGPELLYLAFWVFGSIALVVALAGLLVALVRPFWLIFAAFALSAIVMVVVLQTDLAISAGLGLGYILLGTLSSRSVVEELNDRLVFSISAITQGQGLLVRALILLICINFGLGYRDDAIRREFIIPPALRQSIADMAFPRIEAVISAQVGIRPEEKATAIKQAQQEFERSLAEAETGLQPYASFVWLLLAFIVSGILNISQSLVSWVPELAMGGVFASFKAVGVARVVTETKEQKRLVLW